MLFRSVYGMLFLPMVFLALGGYLVSTDMRDVKKVGPAALTIFVIGIIGLFLGGIVSANIPVIAKSLGREHAAMGSGLLTAFWCGATSNFATITAAVNAPVELQTPLYVIGSIMCFTVLSISLLLVGKPTEKLNGWLKPRRDVEDYFPDIGIDQPTVAQNPLDFVMALGIVSGIALVSWGIGTLLAKVFPGLGIVLLTVVALSILGPIVGRYMRPAVTVPGTNLVGPFGIYAFLTVMGLQSGSFKVLIQEPLIFLQALIIMVIFLAVVLIGAKLIRIPFELASISINAQVGGYPDAIAVGSAYQKAFVPVGIILAVLGVVFGTYLGIGTYLILK